MASPLQSLHPPPHPLCVCATRIGFAFKRKTFTAFRLAIRVHFGGALSK